LTPATKAIETMLADQDAPVESKSAVLNTMMALVDDVGVHPTGVVGAAVCCLLDASSDVRVLAASVLSRVVPQWHTRQTVETAGDLVS
jgi:hypothetical protein